MISFIFLLISVAFAALPEGVVVSGPELQEISSRTHFEFREYRKFSPATISLSPGSKLRSCRWREKPCQGTEWTLSLDGQAGSGKRPRFELTYTLKDTTKKFIVDVVPANFPVIHQTGRSAGAHPLIFSASHLGHKNPHGCYLIKLSPAGEFEFFRHVKERCGDFRPHSVGAENFYSYQEVNSGINYVAFIGPRVILDRNFREISRVAGKNDGHEFLLLGADHWIGFEIELGRLENGRTYVNKRIRERKAGKIVHDWGVSDYLRQFGSEATLNISLSRIGDETVAELLHLNTVQVLKNGKWLVGLGYEGVALLDPSKNKLEWVLGGLNDTSGLPVDRQPFFNHTPYLDEKSGELSLFSNSSWGNITVNEARILRYKLSPEMKISGPEILRDSGERVRIMGSLQVNDDLLTIGFGSKEKASADMIEMSGPAETWRIKLPPEWVVYRFYRSPMGYHP